jgi:UDP-N-acetylglucosamine:LPS N-acetylglucosamine transferase
VKRRVLQIVGDPAFGGPQSQSLQIYEELAARGWELMVVLPSGATDAAHELVRAGVEVLLLPMGWAGSSRGSVISLPLDWGRLRALLFETSPCLVILAGPNSLAGALAARSAGIPIVLQLPATASPMLRRAALMWVRKLADAVLSPEVPADQYARALETALSGAQVEPAMRSTNPTVK